MSSRDFLWLNLRELPYFRALLRAVEAEFYQQFDLPSPTLDLGCGDGHFASTTFNRKLEVGLDPWYGPIHQAAERDAYLSLVQADGSRIPFPDGCFASAVSNSVLEHIPQVEAVLYDLRRILQPGSLFLFCVPNPRYLTELSMPAFLGRIGLKAAAKAYTGWFQRMSRTVHADLPETWQTRLEAAGFRLEKWWHYFSPQALHVLEWGHYFSAPTLLPRAIGRRWIIAPYHWNLFLTEKYLRRFSQGVPDPHGTYTFYVARSI